MSVKSLLQIILFLLILLIIGGIYMMYFYTGPTIKKDIIGKNQDDKEVTNNSEQELLEVAQEKNQENINNQREIKDNSVNLDKQKNIEEKNLIVENNTTNLKKKNVSEQIKNLTKEIEYITSNKNGDIFKISAKYGKTNIENSNILDLEKVEGIISSKNRSEIFITSNYAEYNYDNQNSKFHRNVELKYDNKIITCNNLDLIISDNIAVAYENVIVKDESSIMKAQMITFDIITKDIIINSDKKIKLITN